MKVNKSSIPPAIGWTCLGLSIFILLVSTVLLPTPFSISLLQRTLSRGDHSQQHVHAYTP